MNMWENEYSFIFPSVVSLKDVSEEQGHTGF